MNIPLFDGHCDTMWKITDEGGSLAHRAGHIDLDRGLRYSAYAQIFSIFMVHGTKETGQIKPTYRDYQEQMSVFRREMNENCARVVHCRTSSEARAAFSAGKAAAFLSVEGGEMLDCDPENLRQAAEDGVRLVNITWNFENELSGSCRANPEKGLTEQGKTFAKEIYRLGMLPDVSHLSEAGFWDLYDLGLGPIVASHSNSKALCDHPRNLTDRQFSAIVETGGVAGINMFSPFVGNDPEVGDLVRHILHFLELGGEKTVTLGSDFDGCDMLPRGIEGMQDFGKLYEALLRMNIKETTVQDIFFNNLLRLFD